MAKWFKKVGELAQWNLDAFLRANDGVSTVKPWDKVIFSTASGKTFVSYLYYDANNWCVNIPNEILEKPGKFLVEAVGWPESRCAFEVVQKNKPAKYEFHEADLHIPEDVTRWSIVDLKEDIKRHYELEYSALGEDVRDINGRLTVLEANTGSGGGSASGLTCILAIMGDQVMPMMSDESDFVNHVEEIAYGMIPVLCAEVSDSGFAGPMYRAIAIEITDINAMNMTFYFLSTNGSGFNIEMTGSGFQYNPVER